VPYLPADHSWHRFHRDVWHHLRLVEGFDVRVRDVERRCHVLWKVGLRKIGDGHADGVKLGSIKLGSVLAHCLVAAGLHVVDNWRNLYVAQRSVGVGECCEMV
jgi:hypothetical protein